MPPGWLRVPGGLFIRALYAAFRVLTGLRVTQVPAYQEALQAAGFQKIAQRSALQGLLVTQVWRYTDRREWPVTPSSGTPSFALVSRQPLSLASIVLAIVTAAGAVSVILYGLDHAGHARLASASSGAGSSAGASAAQTPDDDKDDKDDPSQIDTIVLGDPADAPVPGRRGNHISPVHPTIVVHLPRFGDQTGLIPNSPAGHLLFSWLAAFNQASFSALTEALPNVAPAAAASAQLALRQQTGGFNLLSAKEVEPGVLVFRLRDQTPAGTEALGTLQVRPGSIPATVATFSLRSVPSPHP